MGDLPRFIPPGHMVEVTTRTLQGMFLLRPGRDLNDMVVGILARAAERTGVGVVSFTTMSNHMQMLLLPKDARELASFMEYVNGNVAKEAGRLHEWKEKIWGRRYKAIVVSHEPEAQIARLRYILENGCKEGLVKSPRHWPGATSTEAHLTGRPVRGWWFDRTAEYEARKRGERFTKYEHAEEETLELVPLPCWSHLDAAEHRERVAGLVREIEEETRERLDREGRSPLGRRRILRQHPHSAPARPSRSPAPLVHAACADTRAAFRQILEEFCRAYRQASERLRAGERNVPFPPGSFPPRLPFCSFKDPPVPTGAAINS